ncbi:alpha/beta hydrolase [Novipirellula aureliae]|nr:alpha/beta hydrolase [Novipirellula aureliae]
MSQATFMIRSYCFIAIAVAAFTLGSGFVASAERTQITVEQDVISQPFNAHPVCGDRLWLINTRSMTTCTYYANLEQPNFKVSRLENNGRTSPSSTHEYLSEIGHDRPVVVYVHGYRFNQCDALRRGLLIHREIAARNCGSPVDWVIFSWPSEQDGFITHDVREKAKYSDTQALYLAWLLREQLNRSIKTKLIGYSLGGRVVTGSLHALAGGMIGGRNLPGELIKHADIDVGLVAPAIGQNWLSMGGYHGLAPSNIDSFLLLYNQRDAVLKRYWLLSKVRGAVALGFGRLPSLTPRGDGSEVDLRARDCSRWIGIAHDEVDYYQRRCNAGNDMARMISDTTTQN